MQEPRTYASPHGVEAAIKDGATKQAALAASLSAGHRITLEYFNRLLSRVFSEGHESGWVLKGGTSILARVPNTRSTSDVDLVRQGLDLDNAVDDLNRLASIDLADHFRFEFVNRRALNVHETQPYAEGCRVTFRVFIGTARRGQLQIDLVVGSCMTQEPSLTWPANALRLPRLVSFPYRLYPVVDQIADKVCATMTDYRGRPSSREKDLVDLVVLATTHDINGSALGIAIAAERIRRGMQAFERFVVPAEWDSRYRELSKSVPHCSRYGSVESATALTSRLIDPVLAGSAQGKTWSAIQLGWV